MDKNRIINFIKNSDTVAGLKDLQTKVDEKLAAGKNPKVNLDRIDAVRRAIYHISNASDFTLNKCKDILDIDLARAHYPGASDFRIVIKIAMHLRYGTQNSMGLSQNSDYLNGNIIAL